MLSRCGHSFTFNLPQDAAQKSWASAVSIIFVKDRVIFNIHDQLLSFLVKNPNVAYSSVQLEQTFNTLLVDVSDFVSSLCKSYMSPSDQKYKYLPKFTSKKYFPMICPKKHFRKIDITPLNQNCCLQSKYFLANDVQAYTHTDSKFVDIAKIKM